MSINIITKKSIPSKIKGKKSNWKISYLLTVLLLLPITALAQSTDYLTTFVYNACTYASGNVARAVGVLVIMLLGYKTLKGTFDWHFLVAIIIGLGLVIGGSYYGKTILLGGV